LNGGHSDPLLLLHGQPGGGRDWDRVVAALSGRVSALPAIDRPGWDGASGAIDVAGNAGMALGLLDAQDVSRATVVGHSFGGAIAAWLAATHPERVGRLVLVAPAANVASLYALDRVLATPVAGAGVGAIVLGSLGLALGSARPRRFVSGRTRLDEAYLNEAGRVLRAPWAWRAFYFEQRAMIRDLPALEARLHRISAPTTIVGGSADRIVPPRALRRLAMQIRGAELVVVGRGGHLLPQQHAGRLAEIIGGTSRR
jgi:2-hydroxy-6-oxonona-2,4-dienedioate hydrolase